MSKPTRSLGIAFATALLCALLLVFQRPPARGTDSQEVLSADKNLKWYRGNIHTHSLWSDGDDYPESIAIWYREHDYDFLCFTDHNILPTGEKWIDVQKSKGGQKAYDSLKSKFGQDRVDERTRNDRLEVRLKRFDEVNEEISRPGEFLLIQGEEITDRFQNKPVHLNGTNVESLITPRGGDSIYEVMQNNVDAVQSQRERSGRPMLVHLNHPNFGYAITAEDLMRVRGENFFEVYNGHPSVHNSGDRDHVSAERMWDIMLTWRIVDLKLPLMYGLATDDGHNYHNIPSRAAEPGRGWIMVLADELSPAALIDAMERGRFYASTGVDLQRVATSTAGMEIEVDADEDVEYTIDFIGTRKGFDRSSEPRLGSNGQELHATRKYSDEIGDVLKSVSGSRANYEFDGRELYVRARITSSRRHPNPSEPGEFERAWVQPIKGPAAASFDSTDNSAGVR